VSNVSLSGNVSAGMFQLNLRSRGKIGRGGVLRLEGNPQLVCKLVHVCTNTVSKTEERRESKHSRSSVYECQPAMSGSARFERSKISQDKQIMVSQGLTSYSVWFVRDLSTLEVTFLGEQAFGNGIRCFDLKG
jgi:hypothetical protein